MAFAERPRTRLVKAVGEDDVGVDITSVAQVGDTGVFVSMIGVM